MPLLGDVTRSNFFSGVVLTDILPRRLRSTRNRQLKSSFFIVENGQFPETAQELSATAVTLKNVMDARNTHVVGFLGTTPDLM